MCYTDHADGSPTAEGAGSRGKIGDRTALLHTVAVVRVVDVPVAVIARAVLRCPPIPRAFRLVRVVDFCLVQADPKRGGGGERD